MVRLTTAFTTTILALCTTVLAKGCQQVVLSFSGSNVGSAVADCKVGCKDAMISAVNNFQDPCHSNDAWEEPIVTESSYVRQCTNATNCDTTLASVCECEAYTTMWRAFKDDQEGDTDDWWSCEPGRVGNRLAMYTPGFLLGRGLEADGFKINKGVDCS